MTAPAHVGSPSTPTPAKTNRLRERVVKAVPDRVGSGGRTRSPAAERAYARRAQRSQNLRGTVLRHQPGVTPKAPFVVMVMVVLGVGLAAIMWLSTQAAADSYRLQEANAEATKLSRQVEQLRQEVAHAESPTKLAEAAAKLGMVLAGDPAKVRQLPDGSIEVFGEPSAVQAPAPPSPPADQQQPAQQQAVPGGP